jgi:V8-like Glu-specific endopeptidase
VNPVADTPMPNLSKEQLDRIREAILDGFRKTEALADPLRFKWGLILERYFDVKRGTYYIVGDLLDWAEERGKTRELVVLVYSQRPGNTLIKDVATSLGISLAEATEKYGKQETYTVDQPPPKPALEAMVVANSRFVDFGDFQRRFQSLGDRICRVETSKTLGTGFLVGPNLVLTNYHVIEPVYANPALATKTICRFDFHATSDLPDEPLKPKECTLGSTWLVAHSPYSTSDKTGVGDPQPNELDYALLQLADDFGNTRTSQGNERGWFKLDGPRPLLAVRDFAVVPQHPEGQKLGVAWGSVVDFNGPANRVRYDTRTGSGSSGSPCFTIELDLFGLHHATDPKVVPKFNQAIPLDLIAKDLKQKGVSIGG